MSLTPEMQAAVDRDIMRRGRDALRDYCEAQTRGAQPHYGDVPATVELKTKIRDHHRAVLAYLDAKPLEAWERRSKGRRENR